MWTAWPLTVPEVGRRSAHGLPRGRMVRPVPVRPGPGMWKSGPPWRHWGVLFRLCRRPRLSWIRYGVWG